MSKFNTDEYVFVKTRAEIADLETLLESQHRRWWMSEDRTNKAGRRIKVTDRCYGESNGLPLVRAAGLTWLEDMLLTRDEYFDRKGKKDPAERIEPLSDDTIKSLLVD